MSGRVLNVFIENQTNNFKLKRKIRVLIKKVTGLCYKSENLPYKACLDIRLVDNDKMAEINLRTRNINNTTDVLSFPMMEFVEGKINVMPWDYINKRKLIYLGEIIITPSVTKSQAEMYGHSFEREMGFLVSHGMFHLLGYDHGNTEDEKKMIKKQESVLKLLMLER